MSTRCNVIVKENDSKFFQLYHHYDGYPEGVGVDLENYIKEMDSEQLEDGKKFCDFLSNPSRDTYEYEGTNIHPHGDIEYLYVVDISKQKIQCYEIKISSFKSIDCHTHILNNTLNNFNSVEMVYEHSF